MEQFDKFEKTLDCPATESLPCFVAENTWRAALEEMLTQLNNIYDGDFENSEIVKWIKQELGDT